MKNLKQDWLIWVLIAIPFVFIGIYWNDFPAQVPTHFGIDGKPDDYSNKAFGLIMLPGINLVMYFLFIFLAKITPANKYENFLEKLTIFRTVIHAFISFVMILTCLYSLGYSFNISLIMMYAVATLFLVIGNYMGNIRHNYFIGVRTPWTLSNETIWTKTHRLTAKIWVMTSVMVMFALGFLNFEQATLLFGSYVTTLIVFPIVFSYVAYKKLNNNA